MKKIISIVLAVVMVMTSLVTFMISGVADDSTETSTRTASYATIKPVIDGSIDEIWNTTEQLDFSAPSQGKQTAYAKVLWDETGLYILTCITPNVQVSYHKAVTYYISEQFYNENNNDPMTKWWNYPDEATAKYNLYKGNYAFRVVPETTSANYAGLPQPLIDNGSIAFKMTGNNPLADNPLNLDNVEWKVIENKGSADMNMIIEMFIPIQTHVAHAENTKIKFGVGTSDASTGKAQATGMSLNSSGAVVATSPDVLGDLTLIANSEDIARISGVSLGIGSDLTVNYYATVNETYIKESEAANVKMRFTRNGKSVTVGGEYDSANSRYLFSYTGITPQCIGDNIKAELLYKDKTIATKDSYSVLEYCQTLHADSKTGTELKTLIADLLEYGAAAQKYMNYNTENLVNTDDWVITEKTEFVAPETTATIIEGSIDQNNKFTSVGVSLSNVNQIFFRFKVEDAENAKITIQKGSGEKVEVTSSEWIADGDTYLVYTNAISATGHDTSYTVSLTVGEQTQSVSYSINSYVSAKYEDAEVGELVKALYNLGVSAQAYK